MGERFAFRTYAGIEWAATRLPETVGKRLFDIAGRLAFMLGSSRRAIVAANMGRVLGLEPGHPLVTATTREAYRSYARYWFETFRLRVWDPTDLEERVESSGFEHIKEAIDAGTGCLMVLAHLGNWDAGGAWLAARGVPTVAVAEDLRPERLMELFRSHREALGVKIVVLDRSASVMGTLAGYLRASSAVGLVADRDLSGNGVEVEMFGATRRIPAGPAVLSRMTGAPLLVTGVYITDRGWRVVINPPIEPANTGDRKADVAETTKKVAAGFERMIAADPPQWHMFQPGWP
jgi:KDO2-lipid IV(A) lauroyltransferase